jgi:MerR family transcriptional regulator, repressor of the yfmOP operon
VTTPTAQYRIGEVAERAGVTTRTLRYYQEVGLLDPSDHRPGSNRRYSDADVARLMRIIELRDVMGFDLDRIREILRAEDRLAELRQEVQRKVSVKRRREIIREAADINRHMRRQVREKMDVLQGFLAELEERAAHIHTVAEQWGVDLEPDPGPRGRHPVAMAGTGVRSG